MLTKEQTRLLTHLGGGSVPGVSYYDILRPAKSTDTVGIGSLTFAFTSGVNTNVTHHLGTITENDDAGRIATAQRIVDAFNFQFATSPHASFLQTFNNLRVWAYRVGARVVLNNFNTVNTWAVTASSGFANTSTPIPATSSPTQNVLLSGVSNTSVIIPVQEATLTLDNGGGGSLFYSSGGGGVLLGDEQLLTNTTQKNALAIHILSNSGEGSCDGDASFTVQGNFDFAANAANTGYHQWFNFGRVYDPATHTFTAAAATVTVPSPIALDQQATLYVPLNGVPDGVKIISSLNAGTVYAISFRYRWFNIPTA